MKYSKLEEKRGALRQAVKLLEQQIDKVQAENLDIRRGNTPHFVYKDVMLL